MDSLYASMEYLDTNMACNWLRRLVENPDPIPPKMLMSLCDNYAIPVFIDCSSLEGFIAPLIGNRYVVHRVTGVDICQVQSPSQAIVAFEPHGTQGFEVAGLAIANPDQNNLAPSHIHSWSLTEQSNRPFLFRPKDIKELALALALTNQTAEKPQLPKMSQTTPENTPPLEKPTRHVLLPNKRMSIILQWFNEQSAYNVHNLRNQKAGIPGAKNACWHWLKEKGFTGPGELFGGSLKKGTQKTKSFDDAWLKFLSDTSPTRPKNLA